MPSSNSPHIDLDINTTLSACLHLQRNRHRSRHVNAASKETRRAVNSLRANLVGIHDTPDIRSAGRVHDGPGRVSASEFREALSKLASTVTVVTTGGHTALPASHALLSVPYRTPHRRYWSASAEKAPRMKFSKPMACCASTHFAKRRAIYQICSLALGVCRWLSGSPKKIGTSWR